MSLRTAVITVLVTFASAGGANAYTGPMEMQPDGTYVDAVHQAATQYASESASRDSGDVSASILVAGGAAGLAALFVAGVRGHGTLTSGSSFTPPSEVFIPPLVEFDPPIGEPVGGLPGPLGPLPPGGPEAGPTLGVETTVTPEPLSMALLASGLAGMGGASALKKRRRRKAQHASR